MKSFIPFITAAAAIGVYFFYIEPAWSDVEALQLEDKEFRQAVKQAEELENLIQKLEADANDIGEEDMERLDGMVPEEIDPLILTYDIYGFANVNGVDISNVSIGDTSNVGLSQDQNSEIGSGFVTDAGDQDSHSTTQVMFDITLSYEEFLDFLRLLEASLQLFDVASISFGVLSDEGEDGEEKESAQDGAQTFTISVDTYSAPRN